MTQERDTTTTEQDQSAQIFHSRFAAFYERYARLGSERRLTDPLRQETAGQAYGTVLEVGAGTGLNFSCTTQNGSSRWRRLSRIAPC